MKIVCRKCRNVEESGSDYGACRCSGEMVAGKKERRREARRLQAYMSGIPARCPESPCANGTDYANQFYQCTTGVM